MLRSLAPFLALAVAAIAPVFASPQVERVDEISGIEEESGTRIDTAALVRDLIAWARAEEDVEALILAARMLEREGMVLADAAGSPLEIGRVEREDFPLVEPLSLLAEARVLAEDDAPVLERILDMIASEKRGFLPQAIVYMHDLKGSGRLAMRARAEGGRPALIRARGDGDARLEMVVRDATGREVCRDAPENGARGGDLVCRWTPASMGEYRLELINRGRVWTRILMVTN